MLNSDTQSVTSISNLFTLHRIPAMVIKVLPIVKFREPWYYKPSPTSQRPLMHEHSLSLRTLSFDFEGTALYSLFAHCLLFCLSFCFSRHPSSRVMFTHYKCSSRAHPFPQFLPPSWLFQSLPQFLHKLNRVNNKAATA